MTTSREEQLELLCRSINGLEEDVSTTDNALHSAERKNEQLNQQLARATEEKEALQRSNDQHLEVIESLQDDLADKCYQLNLVAVSANDVSMLRSKVEELESLLTKATNDRENTINDLNGTIEALKQKIHQLEDEKSRIVVQRRTRSSTSASAATASRQSTRRIQKSTATNASAAAASASMSSSTTSSRGGSKKRSSNKKTTSTSSSTTTSRGSSKSKKRKSAATSTPKSTTKKKYYSYCKMENCGNFAHVGGVCVRHGAKKSVKPCKVEGCCARSRGGVVALGFCQSHHTQFVKGKLSW